MYIVFCYNVMYTLLLGLSLLCSKFTHYIFGTSPISAYYAGFYAYKVCIMLTIYIYSCTFLHKIDHDRNKV